MHTIKLAGLLTIALWSCVSGVREYSSVKSGSAKVLADRGHHKLAASLCWWAELCKVILVGLTIATFAVCLLLP